MTKVQLLAGARDFFLYFFIQNGSGANAVFYPVGPGDAFLRCQVAKAVS